MYWEVSLKYKQRAPIIFPYFLPVFCYLEYTVIAEASFWTFNDGSYPKDSK